MGTKYDNTDWSRCPRTYEVVEITIGADGTAQGNGGVSLPCKGCYLQMREFLVTVKVNIGTPATAGLGMTLAPAGQKARPLWVPISDLSQLYFFGDPQAVVDIMYMIG